MSWVLVDRRKGCAIYEDTISDTKRECWAKAYPYVSDLLGNNWAVKHWKRWDASIRSAAKLGITMDRGHVVLDPPRPKVKPDTASGESPDADSGSQSCR